MAGRKIFVGSLPPAITDGALRAEFSKYGQVEEVFVKPGCEPTRQWAFVTFVTTEQAQRAKEVCDRVVIFPGCEKPCDVMLAKNQGMFGQHGLPNETPNRTMVQPDHGQVPQYVGDYGMPMGNVPQATAGGVNARKIFVGSLPDGITDAPLRTEFSRYGMIEDIYMKPNCEPGRQWAFVTFTSAEQAIQAANTANNILQFPGSSRPCEVTLARNQGMFGQDPIGAHMTGSQTGAHVSGGTYNAPVQVSDGGKAPRKIFVGSLPDSITDHQVRAEFSKYGQITDLFLKTGCEMGRQWAFITFATAEQANFAKDSCDRVLTFPGSDRTCEVTIARHQGMFGQEPLGSEVPSSAASMVMLAKNQGKFGQAPLSNFTGNTGSYNNMVAAPMGGMDHYDPAQPPPPATPPPAHLTPWRMYRTASGLPYYHNSVTGVTQWECPPELQVPGQAAAFAYAVPQLPFVDVQTGAMYNGMATAAAVQRYSPY